MENSHSHYSPTRENDEKNEKKWKRSRRKKKKKKVDCWENKKSIYYHNNDVSKKNIYRRILMTFEGERERAGDLEVGQVQYLILLFKFLHPMKISHRQQHDSFSAARERARTACQHIISGTRAHTFWTGDSSYDLEQLTTQLSAANMCVRPFLSLCWGNRQKAEKLQSSDLSVRSIWFRSSLLSHS